MTGTEIVTRARSAMGKGIHYVLGRGGWDPKYHLPTHNNDCDCSGFVAWCLGVSRQCDDFRFPWYETSAIVKDATGDQNHFFLVRWQDAAPGDVLVYGDRTDSDGGRHQGHIGVISACDLTGPIRVIHCSKGAWKATGDAITETSPDAWRARGIVARHKSPVTTVPEGGPA